jgi:hypothetical protein
LLLLIYLHHGRKAGQAKIPQRFCQHHLRMQLLQSSKEDIEALEAFEKFKQDAKISKGRWKEMGNNCQDTTEIIPFLKNEIQCLKNM